MEQQRLQTSEALRVGLALAMVGGYLDAYTYLCRGGVFANAQTGNIVLLGVKLAAGDWAGAANYLPPILAFCLGVLLAEGVRGRAARAQTPGRMHWRQRVLLLETAVLAAAAFAPLGGGWNMLVNWAVSFVCALQVESFRRVRGKAYATTMCTGNLRSGTELLYQYLRGKDPETLAASLRYYAVIAAFIAGAALSAAALGVWGRWALLAACAGLAAVLLGLFRPWVGGG